MKIGISEAAKFLNQTSKQLQRWDNSGVLSAHHTDAGTRYYYQSELTTMKQLLNGITRKNAANQIGVSEKTLWRWDKKGLLKHRYIIGMTCYYLQSDLDRYLALQEEGVAE